MQQDLTLKDALQKLEQLKSNYEDARSSYLCELERDAERGEGSFAQEQRREEHQRQLREAEQYALAEYQNQLNIVQNLRS
ncbi:hypothetical protein NB550_11550 [Vibrio parahaemolyticus]|uniref:hypothetical protein n=1 Tax=Vibrio TaxID=662 RepID=UPI00111021E0|nr:hypothetical protein [Vibrio parahaemolyticus]MCR9888196.1 hypothetical protein [Vibrio parahaemolyticus]MCR9918126.1 hypothetical protein [Vibrio parahaemolyticus]TMX39482.1 hypothetical protein DA098_09340 [Vibrio parahaemolyticus]TMX80452.1 hypothetical protein DA094_02640 [Vibrio parahaemolyticus]